MSPLPLLLVGIAMLVSPAFASNRYDSSSSPAPIPPAGRSATIPLGEPKLVLTVAGDRIDQLVSRDEGDEKHGARAVYRNGQSEALVEWRTLRVAGLHDVGVNAADRKRGISRRYLCKVRAMNHRVRAANEGTWSAWRDGSHPEFPNLVEVVLERGHWRAVINGRTNFSPPAEIQ